MLAFMARRFVYAIVTLFFISLAGFSIINLPAGTYLDVVIEQLEAQGTMTSEAQIETLKRQYGLDDPLYVQYYKWISGFTRGDFGRSFAYNQPVRNLIGSRLGFTALISFCSLVLTWAIAIPIGVYTATHQYSLGDHVATILGLAGLSIPNFVLALFLMIVASRVFGQHIGGLFSPEYQDAAWGWGKFVDLLAHLWVPVVILATSGTAGLIRVMRGNLLDILNMQFIQAARARGVAERKVIVKHAVRNAVHPLVMMLGMSLPGIISGATIIDIVLNLPTTGPMYFNALQMKDMYLAGTFLMFLSAMLVIGNFLADLLLAWIDPRIRLE